MDHTKNAEPVTVTRTVTMEQIDRTGATAPIQVDLRYDARDPYAVSLRFAYADQSVRWTFARELLMDGMFEPRGDGDVHVCPGLEPPGVAVVLLELVGPDGEALIQAGARELAPFVEEMRAAVPPGTEADHVHLDQAISEILSDSG